jgi:hypothetical protein
MAKKKIVIDVGASDRAALERALKGISRTYENIEVIPGDKSDHVSPDIFITENPDRAAATAKLTSSVRIILVKSQTGELEKWDDLALALAFLNGSIDELRRALTGRPEFRDKKFVELSWTSYGDATGLVDNAVPFFISAGADGENPEIFFGPAADERKAESRLFTDTLIANNKISLDGTLKSGQTYTLSTEGQRPVLRHKRVE